MKELQPLDRVSVMVFNTHSRPVSPFSSTPKLQSGP